jgi:hypothetical protein
MLLEIKWVRLSFSVSVSHTLRSHKGEGGVLVKIVLLPDVRCSLIFDIQIPRPFWFKCPSKCQTELYPGACCLMPLSVQVFECLPSGAKRRSFEQMPSGIIS